MIDQKAVVVFSGGQDSTTCLFWAISNFKEVEAITFDYGQNHIHEVSAAIKIIKRLSIPLHGVELGFVKNLTNSALVHSGDVNKTNKKGLPSSFVPNRNQLFLTVAHSLAQKIGAEHIVTGVCQTDYSGYPDCREEFINSLEKTTNLGSEEAIKIHTPLMHLNKAETFKLADDLGCLDVIINDTVTCYYGSDKRNDFGKGCGNCPSCKLRQKGFRAYKRQFKN